MPYQPLPDHIPLNRRNDRDLETINLITREMESKFDLAQLANAVADCGENWENIAPGIVLNSAIRKVVDRFIRADKLGRLINELHKQMGTFPSTELYDKLVQKALEHDPGNQYLQQACRVLQTTGTTAKPPKPVEQKCFLCDRRVDVAETILSRDAVRYGCASCEEYEISAGAMQEIEVNHKDEKYKISSINVERITKGLPILTIVNDTHEEPDQNTLTISAILSQFPDDIDEKAERIVANLCQRSEDHGSRLNITASMTPVFFASDIEQLAYMLRQLHYDYKYIENYERMVPTEIIVTAKGWRIFKKQLEKEKKQISAIVQSRTEQILPTQIIPDPYLFDFLGINAIGESPEQSPSEEISSLKPATKPAALPLTTNQRQQAPEKLKEWSLKHGSERLKIAIRSDDGWGWETLAQQEYAKFVIPQQFQHQIINDLSLVIVGTQDRNSVLPSEEEMQFIDQVFTDRKILECGTAQLVYITTDNSVRHMAIKVDIPLPDTGIMPAYLEIPRKVPCMGEPADFPKSTDFNESAISPVGNTTSPSSVQRYPPEFTEVKKAPPQHRKTIHLLISETAGKYQVALTSADFGNSMAPVALPDKLKDYALQELLAKISLEQIAHGCNSPLPGEIGEDLWETFFQNADFNRILHSAYDHAPCRICIETNDDKVPHILALPWEYLRIASKLSGFLVDKFSIIRQVNATGNQPPEPVFTPPLKFLAAIVQPRSLTTNRFDVQSAKQLLDTLHKPGQLEITQTPATTISGLAQELENGVANYDGFIFWGHGAIETLAGDGEGTLLWENATDPAQSDRVNADRLMMALRENTPPLKLVLLNACEGGGEHLERGYRSVAAQLVAQDIPWGIGWKYRVLFDDTLTFTEAFLLSLAKTGSVETAVINARKKLILDNSNAHPSWGSPSLFARHNWSLL